MTTGRMTKMKTITKIKIKRINPMIFDLDILKIIKSNKYKTLYIDTNKEPDEYIPLDKRTEKEINDEIISYCVD